MDVENVDSRGYPLASQPEWYYPESFGGVNCHQLGEIAPDCLHAKYVFGDGEVATLAIFRAGLERGCAEHDKTVVMLPPDPAVADLTEALRATEEHAAALDARQLIECRFFGPCGQTWLATAK
ncbi:hypothetical protein DMH18_26500 [Streptomyces sp. WAC 06783]|uniref:hypothetical protein n=1 Tax=Streptomyces sp. WAC 06783 TaxID=2203211 RepID=UPI000F7366D9|nr:hypothetical protein [Streptomyces sp. WAC 06783]RSO06996.1 hypothetical protein DMH18_26500 [Streptomyces sp. WAC 06783]